MKNFTETHREQYRDEAGKLHLAVIYRDEDTLEEWKDDQILDEDAE